MTAPPLPDDELRQQLTSGELYRLASLVGTDAKTPFTNLVNYIEHLLAAEIERAEVAARLDEANKSRWLIKRLLERAHKWQLTKQGRTDMLIGELLMPQDDRIKQLEGQR